MTFKCTKIFSGTIISASILICSQKSMSKEMVVISSTNMMVETQVLIRLGAGVLVDAKQIDATKQWVWSVFKPSNASPMTGWIWAAHLGKKTGNSGQPRTERPAADSSGGHSHYESPDPTNQPTRVWGPGADSDPNYNSERSPYEEDGTRSLENEMRNETLYGTPYDPNNLTEAMYYCTLNRCD